MYATWCKVAMLAAESQKVVGLRSMKFVLGGPGAYDEAVLMCSEKIKASRHYGTRLMAGSSLDSVLDGYRGLVQANVLRLSGS